ncbi:hypothetical protein [Moraxella lacunata]
MKNPPQYPIVSVDLTQAKLIMSKPVTGNCVVIVRLLHFLTFFKVFS